MATSSAALFNMTTAKTVLSAAASVAATAMLARSIVQDFLPPELKMYFFSGIFTFFNRFSSQLIMVIDEFDGLVNNQIYEAAETYLGGQISPNTQTLKVSKAEKEKNFTVTMDRGEEIVDLFNGVKFKWVLICTQIESKNFYNPRDMNSTLRSEVRSFQLSFHKKHRDMVIETYLPYIIKEANSMKQKSKTLKIFTTSKNHMYGGDMSNLWNSVNLDHPSTFETLAMDSELKNTIMQDLERFVKRKDYYRKVGKAWKRGYLLYGPPGTGKSSLIAAMANYLKFDIYDLELTGLRCNSELRTILVATANRSILVVEDIDCSIEFQERMAEAAASHPHSRHMNMESQVTLSGLLNFIDGLWSSCGDERIIVFTTNYKDKLDPALLRPGRMDLHIHMSYCTPHGFKVLVSNYLGIKDHVLFEEIEDAIRTTEVTPAEVAEQLMKGDDPDVVLGDLIEFLEVKKKEKIEGSDKKEADDDEEKKSDNN